MGGKGGKTSTKDIGKSIAGKGGDHGDGGVGGAVGDAIGGSVGGAVGGAGARNVVPAFVAGLY